MKKILVIDDEQINRMLVSNILKSEGYELFEASGGKEGIELAKKIMPNLIICDMRMPEVDGMEVLDMLKMDASLMSIPFLFLTSNTDTVDQKVALKSGANAYLHKPINKDQVIAEVKNRI